VNVYPISYTDKNVAKARDPIEITAGKKRSVAVKAPANGRVQRLIVWQQPSADGGGTPVDFEVELLDSKIPFPAGEYNSADDPADLLDAYRILVPPNAPLAGSSGEAASLTSDNFGLEYRNKDGSYSDAEDFIYLLISPTSAATTTVWYATIVIHTNKGASG